VAPDKFSQKNLFITVRFSIGGKKPVFIECDLSKKHLAKDVVRHVLTLYRKNKVIKEKVQFSASVEEPEAFELRYVEDDSDSDSEEAQYDDPRDKYYKADMELRGLDLDQPIGEFETLVLVEKRNWAKIKEKMQNKSKMNFLTRIPDMEGINVPGGDLAQSVIEMEDQNRLFYVVVQCIPIPLIRKFTSSKSIIIPVILPKRSPLK